MENPNTEPRLVNIKIRAMHGQVSTYGLFLEANNFLSPKLRPGEIVSVPDDHIIFSSPSMHHIEITRAPATRPLTFDTLAEANMQVMSPEKAVEAAGMIATSLDMSAEIRQQNLDALNKAREEGTYQPPVVPNFARADAEQGLGAPRSDNAVPLEENGAPAARSRRKAG